MSKPLDNSKQRIVCASWLISTTGASIKRGAVLLCRDQILEIAEVGVLSAQYPDIEVEYFEGAFIPALVNAHMHLELSHLPAQEALLAKDKFIDWVEDLLARRVESTKKTDEIETIIASQIAQQFDSGVVFIGDVGNIPLRRSAVLQQDKLPEIYHMLEFLGSSKEAVEDACLRLSKLSPELTAVAHAPYSTRPELLKKIKKRCDIQGDIFSIHAAEVDAETDFLQSATGAFYDFLVKRGVWQEDFFKHGANASSTIEYLANLGLLNDKTLLVHCVHVTKSDLKLIKKSGAHICICPGSNTFLHSGRAPIEDMLDSGLLPAMGTDSIASNHQLDMWEEMKCIKKNYPSIKAVDILAMATTAGAKAFGQSDNYGEIAAGKKGAFLHVYCDKIKNCITESDLLNMLVSNGRPEKIEWIQQTFVKSRNN